MNISVRWCTTHLSLVIREDDDPDLFWRCETSNLTGDREACVVTSATIEWEGE